MASKAMGKQRQNKMRFIFCARSSPHDKRCRFNSDGDSDSDSDSFTSLSAALSVHSQLEYC